MECTTNCNLRRNQQSAIHSCNYYYVPNTLLGYDYPHRDTDSGHGAYDTHLHIGNDDEDSSVCAGSSHIVDI
jgi:hypothetical protein